MPKTIAILATLDTKAAEADFMRQEIQALGGQALLIDLSVMGESPKVRADITKEAIAQAGGSSIEELRTNPSRQKASPVLIQGATKVLLERIAQGSVHAVVALGGTQGTSNCSQVLQALPYGFPKVMLSTAASGDTKPFVGIKDITMMFSVSDILGLNPFARRILANAAAAAWGMAQVERSTADEPGVKGVIGLTNLGVLTQGSMHAIDLFHQAGYEVITFHAIGAGGEAMEQMMREGLITAVFDYALGDIADGVYGVLRAAGPKRLTVAGELGLPQVVCPGGSEHLGILLNEPNVVPPEWASHQQTFHNPFVFVPRLRADEQARVAQAIADRLRHAKGKTKFLMPLRGVSRYSATGGELFDPELDRAYWEALQVALPDTIETEALDLTAEDPAFVEQAVRSLIAMIEG
ncbi:MAG: Tm-1-like ATP-binding domain-containing protein [Planctomycetes bacterium]|nr:Tm-1-like ATP-binding domain-containing protein [Planctomycetota bacterium]MCB9909776.1 Tm-1-like ATP-binding domain-containing protein [Planctomycetota bacterium]MCB9912315.1 Tm-1-like ATP-binding domain-containing protein [Planctomycetota bacterium]